MPKPEPDPYVVLGVARAATEAELRTAYRDLVAKYHPDRHQGNPLEGLAAAKMAEVNRAYEILSDPERRAAYDRGELAGAGPRFTTVPGGGRRRRPWLYVLGLVLLLPLLVRLGAFVVRGLFQATAGLRGTPAGLVVLAVAAAVLILLFVRYRRRHR